MLIVHVTANISPQALESLRDTAQRMVEATRAEPGCILYTFNFDILAPGVLRIVEVWADQAALDAHFATPHMAEFSAAIRDKVQIVSAEKYETSGPLPLRG